jgi:hypothetical protein
MDEEDLAEIRDGQNIVDTTQESDLFNSPSGPHESVFYHIP